jgi:putative ABC transport system permease protein
MRTRMTALWLRLRAAAGGPGRFSAAWVTLTGTGAAASVAFGLLVFASVLASLAIPRESAGLSTAALQRVIAASQPADRTVVGTVPETSMTDEIGEVQAADIAAVGASLRARLTAGGLVVASDPPAWAGLTTEYVPVSGAARAAGDGPPQFEMTYRTELTRYSQIVAGQLPVTGSEPGKQAVVQAAVTTATAARFGLKVGTRLNAGQVQLVITGIIRPTNPAATFWTQEPVAARPTLTPAAAPQLPYWLGAAFVGPGALPLIEANIGAGEMQVAWAYAAALGGLTAGQASGFEASVSSLVSSGATVTDRAGNPVTATISSQIPAILAPFTSGESAVAPVLELLYVSLTVIGAIVVLLGARLVAQRRAAEFTLMRARGAALYQLAWLVLRASVVIAAAAGALAAVLAIGLTPGDGDALGWWLAGLTIAVTLAGPVLISVVPQRVAAPVTGRTGGAVRRAPGRGPAARRIIVEIALVALAIGGLVVLRNEGPSSGNSGLYTSAAPVLVAIPVAVVLLRCYPLLARELARIAGASRGVVAFVGLTRATRTPPGTVLPAFALVLVLAMVAFPNMVSTSVTRSQVAESWQQVGADAIIAAPPDQSIPAALQSQISSVPGVVSTAAAEVDAASLAAGTELSVMFVDPAQYAAVIDQAPGPRFPLAPLSGYGGQPGAVIPAVIPAVATAAAAALVGTAPVSVNVNNTTITIRPAGQTGLPGVPTASGMAADTTVIVPAQALASPLVPNVMLVAGPGLDAARLSADVSRALPGASVTFRATALAALTTSPVPQAAQTALTQGMAAAAGFGALVLLLSLLLTAWTRDMTLARLATMGLRRWQAQLLQATETLPPVVAAAIGGVACAWLLVPLVGPSLNLAAFAGTGSAAAVTLAVVPLVGSAAGLVLAALLVLAVQAVITYHRGSARVLRISDEGGPGT